MSCQKCDEAQEVVPGNFTGMANATYVRVDAANVLIAGCREHLKRLIDLLHEAYHAEELKRLEEEEKDGL